MTMCGGRPVACGKLRERIDVKHFDKRGAGRKIVTTARAMLVLFWLSVETLLQK